jgi:hypothetical protein
MLDTSHCEEYYQGVLKFADEVGLRQQLQQNLDFLAGYANGEGCNYDQAQGKNTRCLLYADWAPHSFQFTMEVCRGPDQPWERWFIGGLIFHGPHDNGGVGGGPPTFSCTLSPTHGWQVHT